MATNLFSALGQKTLLRFIQKDTLFAFDYDGTLAPIHPDPDRAMLSKETTLLLENLSKKFPVAIISGRSKKDLQTKFFFKIDYLVGNHGIENKLDHETHADEAASTCRQWVKFLGKTSLPKGAWIENKKLSLSIHYRESTDHARAKKQILKILEGLSPEPQIIFGKCVINLLEPNSPHKGEALKKILQASTFKHVFYIGDDDTDEKVFEMNHPHFFCVRVGQRKNSAAPFFIRQSEINRLLKFFLTDLNS